MRKLPIIAVAVAIFGIVSATPLIIGNLKADASTRTPTPAKPAQVAFQDSEQPTPSSDQGSIAKIVANGKPRGEARSATGPVDMGSIDKRSVQPFSIDDLEREELASADAWVDLASAGDATDTGSMAENSFSPNSRTGTGKARAFSAGYMAAGGGGGRGGVGGGGGGGGAAPGSGPNPAPPTATGPGNPEASGWEFWGEARPPMFRVATSTDETGETPLFGDVSEQPNPANGSTPNVDETTPVLAVPEPATWATMLIGFAAIGASLRARRARKSALAHS